MRSAIKSEIIALLFLIPISNVCHSQFLEIKTLVTSDSLGYITLLKNNKVSYNSYRGFSPLTITEKRKKNKYKTSCGFIGYIPNERGYGTYKIVNDSVYISFETPVKEKDSIAIEYLPTTENSDVIMVTFIPKSEMKIFHNQKIEPQDVRSYDNSIYITNFITQEAEMKIYLKRDQIPMRLIVNNSFEIQIDIFSNQEITYWYNEYKLYLSPEIIDKSFKMSDLILIEN